MNKEQGNIEDDNQKLERAFESLNKEEQDVVNKITGKVNKRVRTVVGFTLLAFLKNFWWQIGLGITTVVTGAFVLLSPSTDGTPKEELTSSEKNTTEIIDPQEVTPTTQVNEEDTKLAQQPNSNEKEDLSEFLESVQEENNSFNSNEAEEKETPITIPEESEEENEVAVTEEENETPTETIQPLTVTDIEIFSELPVSGKSDAQGDKKAVTDPNIGSGVSSKGKSTSGYSESDLPKYFGGKEKLKNDINENTIGIKVTANDGRKQTSVVRFVVTTKGKVESIEILAPLTPEIDKQVEKAIQQLTSWDAGKKKWKVEYIVAITFD